MWYCYDKLLSRNSIINMVVGSRGHGKTYNAKKRGIKNFLKKGEQFIYVRRYKSEFKKIMTFFDDIKKEFPGHEFKVTKNYGYIDNKICCYFISLSTANNEKSTSYPYVTMIIYDEFIIDKKNQRYISNEVNLFMNLVETVIRLRDNCIVIMLANNVTITNPYFQYFNIYPDFKEGIKSYNNGLISIEMDDGDNDYLNKKLTTRWGKLSNSVAFGKHSIYNESLIGNEYFIVDKKPKNCIFYFSIIYNNSNVGVWYCPDINKYYCDDKIVNTSKLQYVLQKEDMTPNTVQVDNANKSYLVYDFKQYFKNGQVIYKNKFIKDNIYDIMKFIGIK